MRTSELAARWQTEHGRALGVEAARWLAGHRSLPVGVGLHSGRVDLRGLSLPDAQRVRGYQGDRASFDLVDGLATFIDSNWNGIDLSGARMRDARFVRAEIADCIFEGADLAGWRLWNSSVVGCSFERADMRSSALGTDGQGYGGTNSWVAVRFDRANLAGSFFRDGLIRSCTFRNTRLRKVRFGYVSFDDVVFTGLLDAVVFEARQFEHTSDPGPMTRVDFSEAMFRNCDLSGYRFDEVSFPPDVHVIHDFPSVVSRALQLAQISDDPHERAAVRSLEYAADHRSRGSWDSIFVPADFMALGEEAEAAAMVRLYERAAAA